MWWPVLVPVGFLVLIALVIALGTRSTKLYEQEQDNAALSVGGAPRT